MNFYSINICNFRTQYAIDIAQSDCQRRFLAAFQVSSRSFVSLLCLPNAFFRRGPVYFANHKTFPTFNESLF